MDGVETGAVPSAKLLPDWLKGTEEEQLGVAGTAGCAAGLLVVWLSALVIRANLITATVIGLVALLATFHILSTRLIDGRWITLGDVVDGFTGAAGSARRWIAQAAGAKWRDRPVLVPVACLGGLVLVGLFLTRFGGNVYTSYEGYLRVRGAELNDARPEPGRNVLEGETRCQYINWVKQDGTKQSDLICGRPDGSLELRRSQSMNR